MKDAWCNQYVIHYVIQAVKGLMKVELLTNAEIKSGFNLPFSSSLGRVHLLNSHYFDFASLN